MFRAKVRQVAAHPTPQAVTREAVVWAYRMILGREPENDSVVAAAMTLSSAADLRKAFLESSEFLADHCQNRALFPADAAPEQVDWEVDNRHLKHLLAHVQEVWTKLGCERPHWSVLTDEKFLPENIGASEQEFYASGQGDAHVLTSILARAGRQPLEFPTIFEFGCGLGRVTPHLAAVFERVLACDVSRSHLGAARRAVDGSGANNVELRLANSSDLGMSSRFDLWFSKLVLQHNPPPLIAAILRQALFLLNPGGLAVFQVPTYAMGYEFHIDAYLGAVDIDRGMEMHVLPQSAVFQIARENGCSPLEVREDDNVGSTGQYLSNTFVLLKAQA